MPRFLLAAMLILLAGGCAIERQPPRHPWLATPFVTEEVDAARALTRRVIPCLQPATSAPQQAEYQRCQSRYLDDRLLRRASRDPLPLEWLGGLTLSTLGPCGAQDARMFSHTGTTWPRHMRLWLCADSQIDSDMARVVVQYVRDPETGRLQIGGVKLVRLWPLDERQSYNPYLRNLHR